MNDDNFWSGKRVVITGAAGFIACHLVRRVATAGAAEVTAVVRRSRVDDDLDFPNVRIVRRDLTDDHPLADLVRGVDVVYHLAGLTRAHTYSEFHAGNADATRRLADAVHETAPNAVFVLVSSQAAAGPARDRRSVHEDDPPCPVTNYGRSKLAGEIALEESLPNDRWTIIRPPAVFGPRERDILAMFRCADSGFCPLIGLEKKFFSYIYVHDLIEALERVPRTPSLRGGVYFAAAPEAAATDDFAAAIARAMGKNMRILRVPEWIVATIGAVNTFFARFMARPPLLTLERFREIRQDRWICDSSRLESAIGPYAVTPLDTALAATVEWYRREGWIR